MPVGRNVTAFKKLKTDVLTPIARPSPRTAMATTAGLRRISRSAYERS